MTEFSRLPEHENDRSITGKEVELLETKPPTGSLQHYNPGIKANVANLIL